MNWKHSLWRRAARFREIFGPPGAQGLRLLGYHSVGKPLPGDPYGLAVSPESFARQMEHVASRRWGKPVTLSGAALDGTAELAVTFDDGYEDTLLAAAPVLERLGVAFTVCVTPGLLDSGRPYMTWAQLRELAGLPGCEIGAHGLTHAPLDRLANRPLAEELMQSRRRLEEAIGRPVAVMTWPHGAASRRAAAAAKATGFTRAAGSLYGLNVPGRDALLLKRVEITGFDNDATFRQSLRPVGLVRASTGDPAAR